MSVDRPSVDASPVLVNGRAPRVNPVPVITVDGPSGTGKGTLCHCLAAELGWHFLDSGALYRLLALAAQWHGLALDDEASLGNCARSLDVVFEGDRILLEDREVTDDIRTEECGNRASQVAALPAVRTALLGRQLDFRRAPGLVADGRDMGTVVFPDAPLKIYLTASPEKRAERRHKQLNEKGIDVNLARLVREITERDERDSQRQTAPLKPAADAVQIDTSEMGIGIVFDQVIELVRTHLGQPAG